MTAETGRPAGEPAVRACPHRARAWWGQELLADTTRALRVDCPGRAPELWFPWEDVRLAALRSAGREGWDGGEVERFDAGGDGTGVVRRCVTPPKDLEALRDHALVDPERAQVEVLDEAGPGGVMRFPNWGDAADLVAVLDRGALVPDHRRPVVEGSQLLGQTVVAAMRRAPGRRVVSAHMLFVRVADANVPVAIELEQLSGGRTFTSFGVQIDQDGRRCASGTLLLGVPADDDVVRHAEGAAGVPGPDEAVPYDMGVTGREVRIVDAAYTDDPAAPVGPPSIDAWVRFREVPDDPALHAGLLTQFTGHLSIAAALRAHAGIGQREAHRTLSMAVNGIAISFHADVRVDRWVLYRHRSTVVADGMAHSECRAHDESGTLVASFSVDAMIRRLDRPVQDARTAL